MLTLKVKELKSWKEKLVGLIGQQKPQALFFKTRFGIHTFGLKFPIDIIILDKNNKVVKIKINLGPNKLFFWNPVYNRVIELPRVKIAKNNISLGKIIQLIDNKKMLQ